MAIVSSHTLNSVDGTHAGGITVTLSRIEGGLRTPIFEVVTDAGGRFSQEIAADALPKGSTYEMVFQTGDYFDKMKLPKSGLTILRDVVIRFEMPDAEARYHMPLMLAPNSYSVWWSS